MAKRKKIDLAAASTIQPLPVAPVRLLEELCSLIRESRQSVAQAVNSALVLLYWQVGHRIRTEILREKRADYGERIVPTLSAQLAAEFDDGFGRCNSVEILQYGQAAPRKTILSTPS